VTPLPAKAFDMHGWRDCIVTSYDTVKKLWKVLWRGYKGSDLKSYNASEVHPEDANLISAINSTTEDPQGFQEGFEMWLPR
jgi:hypothetical protein